MKSRTIAILLLCTACYTALAFSSCTGHLNFSSRTEHWSEDVVLHDGRLIKVERAVDWTTRIVLTDPFFGFPTIPHLSDSWPDKFRLKFKHPVTQETIKWQGEQHYNPVLLDIVDGVPYLVVYGQGSKKTESIYGCPELPYIYLKYESGSFGKWQPDSVEKAPDILRNANLTLKYPEFGDPGAVVEAVLVAKRGGRARRDMSPADIQKTMVLAEYHSAGSFQRVIPRNYQEWNYSYKNNHLNERKHGECRPPRVPPPQMALAPASEGSPEILELVDYTPDRIVIGDEWSYLVSDHKRESECKKMFRPTDLNDYMQGQRFVNDSTGKKPAPYSRTAQFQMGVRVLCDEYVWFVTHQEEPGKIVISKFTINGDQVYRISFRNPDRVEGFRGYLRIPSLRSEEGYLYFDWLDFRDINRVWHIKRWLKMRMREPAVQNVGYSN